MSSSCREKYLGSLYFTIRHQSSILPYNKSLRSEIKVKSKGDPKGYCENDSSSPNRGHKRRFHFRSEFSWWEFPSTRVLFCACLPNTPAVAPATRAFPLCLGLFTGAMMRSLWLLLCQLYCVALLLAARLCAARMLEEEASSTRHLFSSPFSFFFVSTKRYFCEGIRNLEPGI